MKGSKRFEKNFKESCRLDNIFCYRLRDNSSSFSQTENTRFTTSNMCDFITFDGNKLLNIELKTHKGKSIPISCIRDKQLELLLEYSNYKNVVCGLLIYFEDVEECYFLEINKYNSFIQSGNRKSVPLDFLSKSGIYVESFKKKINSTYNIKKLFKEI